MFPYFLKKFGRSGSIEGGMDSAEEDLLTGLCLGSMQYLPPNRLFIPFLKSFPELTRQGVHEENPELEFWPQWMDQEAVLDGRQRIEPDWVVHSPSTVVVGESKYNSDFYGSQLRREWKLADHQFGNRKKVFLAGISSHSIEPGLEKELNDINWLWINWRSVAALVHEALSTSRFELGPYEERFLKDLRDTFQQFSIYSTYVFDSSFDKVDRATLPYACDTLASATKSEQKSLGRFVNKLPVNISSIPGGYDS